MVRAFGYDVWPLPLPGKAPLYDHLQQVLKHFQIQLVIDAGASFGGYGQLLRTLGYEGRIVSFEPVAAVFQRLTRAAAGDNDWEIHQLALGATEDEREIRVFESTEFSSFHPLTEDGPRLFGRKTELKGTELVSVRRLDSIFNQVSRGIPPENTLLKSDTQGHDMQVIEGGGELLSRMPVVQAELSAVPLYHGVPTYLEFISCMAAKGLAVSGLFPISRTPELHVIEFDAVFTRARLPDKHAASGAEETVRKG